MKCFDFHKTEDCDSEVLVCGHCKGPHSANDGRCPEKSRQNNIKILMDSKSLNYREALDLFPQYTSNSFDLLQDLDEFPVLTRQTYSKVLKPEKNRIIYDRRPVRKSASSQQVDHNRLNKYYGDLKMDLDQHIQPFQSNPFKTTEYERLTSTFGRISQAFEYQGKVDTDKLIEELRKYETDFIESFKKCVNEVAKNKTKT